MVTINKPGVYDMSAEDYHGDPVEGGSLSASGAKLLVPPSTPAHYLHNRLHGQPPKKAFDVGTAAHTLVLGVGASIAVIPDEMLASNGAASTGRAKASMAKARERGDVPLKAVEAEPILAMAEALRAHPIASALFDPERGKPEQSLFWADERHGIMRRARLDWLPTVTPSGRLILADYKTTGKSANPWRWVKASVDYGVHMQHANYVDGCRTLGLADDVCMVFVVQETAAPYLVSVIELDREAVAMGRALMDVAARTFAQCKRDNHWPGYGEEVHPVSLPGYYLNQLERELA